jgi:hypothetical protein
MVLQGLANERVNMCFVSAKTGSVSSYPNASRKRVVTAQAAAPAMMAKAKSGRRV